uniref:Uncharacterized protein n=1 Tax=viral metagenome TaxID=1070528 RepID=A0A6C0LMK2_9ZZZZ
MTNVNDTERLKDVKNKGLLWVNTKMKQNKIHTQAGSISYLLYGEKPSEQSINIKFGHFGEFLSKEMIQCNQNLELLPCGNTLINKRLRDVDLIFIDKTKNVLYYRELKANINLDTEKLPATIIKCNDIVAFLKSKYEDYTIDYAILNWSIYDRNNLTSGISGIKNIKCFEKEGINVEHFGDFCNILGFVWSEEDFYSYFRDIGDSIKAL